MKEIKQEEYIKIRELIFDILFDCYPPDMENFETMTENQAYRLLNNFWIEIEKL